MPSLWCKTRMKVYLLCYSTNSGEIYVYRIFSSRELAEQHIKDFEDKDEYYTVEHEVDKTE